VGIQVHLWDTDFISFGFEFSGIAESYGISDLNFLWDFHTVSHKAVLIYIPLKALLILVIFHLFLFWWYWGLNSGPHACSVCTLPLQKCPHSFLLRYFSYRISLYAQASLGHDPPIYTSCVAGMTEALHHAQLSLVEMGDW
jgi:hypothetical protein